MSVRLLPITLMHEFNSDKSMTTKIAPLFNFNCTELTHFVTAFIKFVESPRCVYIKAGKNILKFHCSTMLKLSFESRHGSSETRILKNVCRFK